MANPLTKRELNREKRTAAIVEIAMQSFLDKGYAATSMSAIAETLGGSKATLWSYFNSKEALFSAVVDAMVRQFAQDVEEVLTSQTFSLPSVRRFCLRFIECMLRERSTRLFRLILAEGDRFPEIRDVFWIRGPAKMMGHVADFYATGFSRDEAEQLAEITISTILGYRSQALIDPTPRPPAYAERFVDTFITQLDFAGRARRRCQTSS